MEEIKLKNKQTKYSKYSINPNKAEKQSKN